MRCLQRTSRCLRCSSSAIDRFAGNDLLQGGAWSSECSQVAVATRESRQSKEGHLNIIFVSGAAARREDADAGLAALDARHHFPAGPVPFLHPAFNYVTLRYARGRSIIRCCRRSSSPTSGQEAPKTQEVVEGHLNSMAAQARRAAGADAAPGRVGRAGWRSWQGSSPRNCRPCCSPASYPAAAARRRPLRSNQSVDEFGTIARDAVARGRAALRPAGRAGSAVW